MLESTRKKMVLGKNKNRKCSVENCNETHHGKGFCKNHYLKYRLKTDSEYRDRLNKRQLKNYYKNHEIHKKRKRLRGRKQRVELYQKLGGKCVSCDEKFNPSLERSNIEIHHKFYDEEDMKIKKKFKGNLGSRQITELIRMFKNGINPNKKFTLLCQQCNAIEGFVRVNPVKAFDTFCWLQGEGYFDEVLKDDPTLKKLTEFVN